MPVSASFFLPWADASTMECCVLVYRAVSTSNLATCVCSDLNGWSPAHTFRSSRTWVFPLPSWLMHSGTPFPVLPFVIPHQKRRSTKRKLADVWRHNCKSVSQLRQEWRRLVGWVGGDQTSAASPRTGNQKQTFSVLFLDASPGIWGSTGVLTVLSTVFVATHVVSYLKRFRHLWPKQPSSLGKNIENPNIFSCPPQYYVISIDILLNPHSSLFSHALFTQTFFSFSCLFWWEVKCVPLDCSFSLVMFVQLRDDWD